MEKPVAPCCAKSGFKKKKDCCEHKQFFSKLSIEGFIAKKLLLKPVEKEISPDFLSDNFANHNKQIFETHYSGLPLPDNIYQIKSLLQPTPEALQTFRC